MKKFIFASAIVASAFGSFSAFAVDTTICPLVAGQAAAGPGAVPASGTAGTHYMMSPIAPKCSANTNVYGGDGTSGAWYAVGANSVKGKFSFAGSTQGGAVRQTVACTIPGGCTATEAQTAKAAAPTS
jgi:hypothetical protein